MSYWEGPSLKGYLHCEFLISKGMEITPVMTRKNSPILITLATGGAK